MTSFERDEAVSGARRGCERRGRERERERERARDFMERVGAPVGSRTGLGKEERDRQKRQEDRQKGREDRQKGQVDNACRPCL